MALRRNLIVIRWTLRTPFMGMPRRIKGRPDRPLPKRPAAFHGRYTRGGGVGALFKHGWFTTKIRYFVVSVEQREAPNRGGNNTKPPHATKTEAKREGPHPTPRGRPKPTPNAGRIHRHDKRNRRHAGRIPTPTRRGKQRKIKQNRRTRQCKRKGPTPNANQRKGHTKPPHARNMQRQRKKTHAASNARYSLAPARGLKYYTCLASSNLSALAF